MTLVVGAIVVSFLKFAIDKEIRPPLIVRVVLFPFCKDKKFISLRVNALQL